jgi:hypothetical protein
VARLKDFLPCLPHRLVEDFVVAALAHDPLIRREPLGVVRASKIARNIPYAAAQVKFVN